MIGWYNYLVLLVSSVISVLIELENGIFILNPWRRFSLLSVNYFTFCPRESFHNYKCRIIKLFHLILYKLAFEVTDCNVKKKKKQSYLVRFIKLYFFSFFQKFWDGLVGDWFYSNFPIALLVFLFYRENKLIPGECECDVCKI